MKKILIILFSIIFTLLLLLVCSDDSEIVAEGPIEDTTESATVYYEENDLINQFIGDLIEKTGCSVDNIRKGQYRSEGICSLEGCYTKIQDDSSLGEGKPALTVMIEGSDEKDISESMYNAAIKVWKTVDPSLSEDTINEAINTLKEASDDIENVEVGGLIEVDYSPYSDNKDSAFIQHWIRISIYNYNLK